MVHWFVRPAGRLAATLFMTSAALLLAASGLRAHDFWIEPSTFHPVPGEIVSVGLRVGQDFVGDPVPRMSNAIEQFIVRQGGETQPITGMENVDPAGWLRADGEATAVIGYRSGSSYIELPAAQFEDYLRQEGLDRIVAARTQRKEQGKPGKERFYRYAKALLTGKAASDAATKPFGFAYEIVPDADPTVQSASFAGRVLYNGKPLAGALIMGMLHSDPSVRLTMRSDERGAFSFKLPRAGAWQIKSVHMVRAWFFSDADWESLWASLTFEAPEARP